MQNSSNCPWTTLGIKKTASTKQIQDAYRRMALKYHPDLNKGCEISSRKFQEAKEAFEHLKELKISARVRNPYPTYRSSSEYVRNRYSGTRTQGPTGDQFHGFRRDRAGRKGFEGSYETGYQANEWIRRNVDNKGFASVQRRLRFLERTGAGVAVLFFGLTLTFAAVGTEVAWKASNRGKSFDDLMKELDKRELNKEKGGRRRRITMVPDNVEKKPS